MVNEVYGEKFHPYGKNKKVKDSKCSANLSVRSSCRVLILPVIDNTDRVIASNVFEEKDFPSMISGRVVLLGDGTSSERIDTKLG